MLFVDVIFADWPRTLSILAISCAMAMLFVCGPLFGFRWLRNARRKAREREQAYRDDRKRRWQLLRPHLVSGAITLIDADLRGWYWGRPYVLITGPDFSCVWQASWGTEIQRDAGGIGEVVKAALDSPGSKMKTMRRIVQIFVYRIRRDMDIPVIIDDVVGHSSKLITKPASETVVAFRKRSRT